MEYKSGTEQYYRQMLELQHKLRKSEDERIKLEQKFNEIMQHSRDAEHERLRIMRHKYHKFLEEDKVRQERNENILRTLVRIETRAKQLAAKTDRFKVFRKQYFENYLKQIPKQKHQQTFEQTINPPQYQNQYESVRRKLFADQPTTTKQNGNVETKLALLEQYLRDNFDNFPPDFPSSTNATKPTNVLYDNKNYLDDASDSKESQEIQDDKYLSPSKMNGEILGNRIEQELDRLRNKNEMELNNNSLDAQEICPEQVISDYKKLVSKSEEKYGLKNDLQNGIPQNPEVFDNINKIPNIDDKEEINSTKLDLQEEEENSDDTKPPTDISLNLSSPSQFKEQLFDESKKDQIDSIPQIKNEENLEISSISEEITSIEKQKVQQANLGLKPISSHENKLERKVEYDTSNYVEGENINTNQQYIEKLPTNEFGEAVSGQQYSMDQKYPPETYPEEYQERQQEEYLEQYAAAPQGKMEKQYVDELQPEYKQDYENTTLQENREVYDEQQYVNPEEQYVNPEGQYASPEEQYRNTEYEAPEKQYSQSQLEQQYEPTEQQYEPTEQQYEPTEQQYERTEQQYEPTEQQYEPTEQQYKPTEQQYEPTEKQYEPTEQQYEPIEQQYEPTEQQYEPTEQQYEPTEQQYEPTEQQYEPTEQQYEPSAQQFEPTEQQYANPEQQYVNPEQQEYPPENYDQQYPQQTYPEGGEYDPQNYPQEYDAQQPENYDTQNYPQQEQQYAEGYDPQQYPQGEGYQEQQFAENTGEYDPQGQYPENLYQTGQEYLQGEQNVDMQYESEQQQNYPDGYIGQQDGQINETVTESEETSAVSEQQKQLDDNKPLIQKKLPNLADMLDTDTSESVKPDNKVSDSDFDFSNTKT